MSKNQFVVCIVGGGSRYTPGILKMLVAEKDRFPLSKVILYDNEYDRQAKIGEYGRILMKEGNVQFLAHFDSSIASR